MPQPLPDPSSPQPVTDKSGRSGGPALSPLPWGNSEVHVLHWLPNPRQDHAPNAHDGNLPEGIPYIVILPFSASLPLYSPVSVFWDPFPSRLSVLQSLSQGQLLGKLNLGQG